MNKLKAIDQFNKITNDWLSDLDKKSENEILMNPCEGCWSLSELYDHVIRVGRSYQIPNFKKSISPEAVRGKRKNIKGFAIFNLGLRRRNIKIKMENFPEPFVTNFTPVKQNKSDLKNDFKLFIKEVNSLKETLMKSSRKNKHYHPMFGNLTAKEWFEIIEVHIAHHDRQKDRINDFLKSQK